MTEPHTLATSEALDDLGMALADAHGIDVFDACPLDECPNVTRVHPGGLKAHAHTWASMVVVPAAWGSTWGLVLLHELGHCVAPLGSAGPGYGIDWQETLQCEVAAWCWAHEALADAALFLDETQEDAVLTALESALVGFPEAEDCAASMHAFTPPAWPTASAHFSAMLTNGCPAPGLPLRFSLMDQWTPPARLVPGAYV